MSRCSELPFEGVDGHSEALRVTAEHPLWSLDDGTWDTSGHLDLGEYVDALSERLQLVGVVQSPDAATVYNFEVADSHTYFVGESGIGAHNTCSGAARGGRTQGA